MTISNLVFPSALLADEQRCWKDPCSRTGYLFCIKACSEWLFSFFTIGGEMHNVFVVIFGITIGANLPTVNEDYEHAFLYFGVVYLHLFFF